MKKRQAFRALSGFLPKIVDGRKICLNCPKPIPRGRRKYCGDVCSFEFAVKNNHHLLRGKLIEEKRYICDNCGMQNTESKYWNDTEEQANEAYNEKLIAFIPQTLRVIILSDLGLVLDHITPIALGGEEFDRTNLQILCSDCNKEKTRKDAVLIAAARKIERRQKGNKQLQFT